MSSSSGRVKSFNVFLQRDDYNMREYISRVLMMVCECTQTQATEILMEANRDRWKNRALCGTYEEPLARHIHSCLVKAGLYAVIRPEQGSGDTCDQDPADDDDDDELEIVETYLDGTPIESEEDLPRYYQ